MGLRDYIGEKLTEISDIFPRKRKKDEDPEKRYPSSLGDTLRAVRRLTRARNPAAFAPMLQSDFDAVLVTYPGSGDNPERLDKIIERSERGEGDLPYYVMRAYADFSEIPTGLLILYAHVIGQVARRHTHAEISALIQGSIDALKFLDQHLPDEKASRSKLDAAFIDRRNSNIYNVKLEPFKRFIDAYKLRQPDN